MIYTQQFMPVITGSVTEFVVDINDVTTTVSNTHNCMLIERSVFSFALIQGGLQSAADHRRLTHPSGPGTDRCH